MGKAMSDDTPVFPGFTALSDQVFVRDPDVLPARDEPHDDPSAVVIYGWGDGLPKHVAKYADGFRALFPRSRIVAVLSPISKAMFSDMDARSAAMEPVVDALFPEGPQADHDAQDDGARGFSSRILLHAMSNTGAINHAATVNAFRARHARPMPHGLLVLDSTPGSTDMTLDNLARWGRAMAIGTAAYFPWPFALTQALWAGVLVINGGVSWLIGRPHPGALARERSNHPDYHYNGARRLYLYSQSDDLINYADIEGHIAETRDQGIAEVDVRLFEGTNHVGHMRKFPEEYWGAIKASWLRAIGVEK